MSHPLIAQESETENKGWFSRENMVQAGKYAAAFVGGGIVCYCFSGEVSAREGLLGLRERFGSEQLDSAMVRELTDNGNMANVIQSLQVRVTQSQWDSAVILKNGILVNVTNPQGRYVGFIRLLKQ